MAFGLSIKIGADISGLHRGLNQASGSVSKFGKSVMPAIAQLAKMAAAAAAAAFAIGSVLVKQSFSGIDAQNNMAKSLDTSVNSLRSLQMAANDSGLDGLEGSITRLNRRLGAAERGSGAAAHAVKALNLDLKALSQMDTDERVATIADAIRDSGASMQLAARHAQDLGFEQSEAAAFFAQGGDAIRSYRQEVDALGLAMSDVDAEQVSIAGNQISRVFEIIRGIADRVAVQLAPLIGAIAQKFTDAAKETKGWQGAIDTAFNVAITGAGYVANAIHGIQLAFNAAIAVAQTVRYAFTESFRMVMDAFVVMNDGMLKGVNATVRALNRIPGVDISEIALVGESEFVGKMREASEDAKDAMTGAWDAVADKWSEPLPAEGFKKFLADINEASRQAAEDAVSSRQGFAEFDDEGAGEIDEKYRERLASRLESLRQSNLDENEAEAEKHARNLELLNESFANELLTQEEWHERLETENQAHQERMNAIRERGLSDLERFTNMSYRGQVQTVSKHLADMTAGVANENKKMFQLNKMAGIANALVSAYEGISLTMSKYPYPLNIGMAAAHAAAAFAQVNAIRSASFGGGGAAPSLAGGTAAPPVTPVDGGTPQRNTPTTVIHVQGGDMFSRSQVNQLLEQIAEETRNGGRVVIA